MHARQEIDFLRRRYATAILRDDAPTADRLRDQLDGLMNRGGKGAGAADPMAQVETPAQVGTVAGGQADLFAPLACVSGRVIDDPDAVADRKP